jgi:hypothetical protein
MDCKRFCSMRRSSRRFSVGKGDESEGIAWSRLYCQHWLSFLEARNDYSQRLLILEMDCRCPKQIALEIVGSLVGLIHSPLLCFGRILRSLYPAKALKLWFLAIIRQSVDVESRGPLLQPHTVELFEPFV